jgi:hypothetical protein
MNSLKIQGSSKLQGSINFNKNVPKRWYAANSAEANSWRGVRYGSGLYVAVADTGTNRVMTSPNAINWTARSVPIANYKAIAYTSDFLEQGTGFVAVAVNTVIYSSDYTGTLWYVAEQVPQDTSWNSVAYGNGRFVAVANAGARRFMYSAPGDPQFWSFSPETAQPVLNAVAFDSVHNVFIAVGNGLGAPSTSVWTSADGINWTEQVGVLPPAAWLGVVVDSTGKAVTVSATDQYPAYYSLDGGVSWTNGNAPNPAGAPDWNSIAVSLENNTFVAVGNNGTNRILATTNVTSWTTQASPQDAAWRDIANGGGKYVAVAESGPAGSPLSQVMWAYD